MYALSKEAQLTKQLHLAKMHHVIISDIDISLFAVAT